MEVHFLFEGRHSSVPLFFNDALAGAITLFRTITTGSVEINADNVDHFINV